MDDFTYVTDTKDMKAGLMKTFTVKGTIVALANVDGEFFAVRDQCTHEQCSLGKEGVLDGNVIICGCHGSSFDVTTGAVMTPPAVDAVQTYDVKIDAEKVYIRI